MRLPEVRVLSSVPASHFHTKHPTPAVSPAAIEHLRCRLFLYAVLPALDDLLRASPEARALTTEPFSIAFKTRSGLRAAYFIEERSCRFVWGKATERADLELFFHSDTQASATFQRRKGIPPMPTRGFSKLGRVKYFNDLTDHLESFLQPSPQAMADSTYREAFVKTCFGVALRAVCQLCEHEKQARELFRNGPHGIAQFQLGHDGVPTWLNLTPKRLDWGRGEPPRPADVCVCFLDPAVAVRALGSGIDAQAELGLGKLRIEGLSPLAEQVNLLLERVELYLPHEK